MIWTVKNDRFMKAARDGQDSLRASIENEKRRQRAGLVVSDEATNLTREDWETIKRVDDRVKAPLTICHTPLLSI